jgi:hypothetical protein
MRKLIAVLFLLIFIMGGCGSKSMEGGSAEMQSPPSQTAEEEKDQQPTQQDSDKENENNREDASSDSIEIRLEKVPYRAFIEQDWKLAKLEPKEGIYAGAYVLQDEYIDCSAEKFNEVTDKQHASFFRYVGYGRPFPTEWVEELKKIGAVPHIAWEPNNGLDEVQDDEYLHQFAKAAGESGVPIFLRYASEVNGAWTKYTGDPKKYKEKWKLVHDVMEKEAPNVAMVYTVFTFPEKTIMTYYPGDDYVDWVGVNVYSVVYHNNDINQKADHEDPIALMRYVYETFSDRKPIQISEFGATHYTVTDDQEHIEFAKSKIKRMYSMLPKWYPRVKSIFYFDVNNLLNAPEGRKINNYAVTDNEEILETYRQLLKNPAYLSRVTNQENTWDKELFLMEDPLYRAGEEDFYMAVEDISKNFPVTVKKDGGYKIIFAGKEIENEKLAAVTQDGKDYLPLNGFLKEIKYQITVDSCSKILTFKKTQ